jgi:RND family efflux transporter MFP subunit
LAIVVVVAGLAIAIGSRYRKPAMDMTAMQNAKAPTPVTIAIASRGTVQSTVIYTATVAPYLEVTVYPRISGRVTYVAAREGDEVRSGQTLARLDNAGLNAAALEAQAGENAAVGGYAQAQADISSARADVAAQREGLAQARAGKERAQADLSDVTQGVNVAQADLSKAEADLRYWKAEIAREETLFDKGAVSQEEYQNELAKYETAVAARDQAAAQVKQARLKVQSAKAGVTQAESGVRAAAASITKAEASVRSMRARAGQARAQIEQAGAAAVGKRVDVSYTAIAATMNGVVTQRMVDPGTVVQPEMPLMKIADLSKVRVRANVAPRDVPFMQVGRTVVVHPQGSGVSVAGRISRVFPQADPQARTVPVEAVVGNSGRWFQSGAYAVMDIVTESHTGVVTVPSSAVTDMSGSPMVWVLSGGKARMRMVETGLTSNATTEIVSGISPGDTVLTSGFEDLQDGSPVQPMDANGNPIAVQGGPSGGTENMPGMGKKASPPKPQNKKPLNSMPGMKM